MIPKLRFQGFNDNWATFKLKEVAEIVTGSTPPTSDKTNYGGSYLFLSPADINGGDIIDSSKKLSLKGWQWVRQIPLDSVVFVCIGSTIGKCGIVKCDFSTNQQINSLIPNEDIDTTFLYSVLLKNASRIKKLAGVQAVPQLNKSDFSALRFNFPSYPEQEKIGILITSLDNKIKLLTKKKEALETYKKGLMQKIFSQELRFKREDGADYPEWRFMKLVEVCSKRNSGLAKGDLDTIGLNEVYGAAGDLEGYTNIPSPASAYVSIVKDGAGVGRVNYLPPKTNTIGTLDMIIPDDEAVLSYFLYVLLKNVRWTKYIVGSTIPHIYYKDWRSEKVQIPSVEEQHKIVSVVSGIEYSCSKILKQIESTEQLKKGLLQQMFV